MCLVATAIPKLGLGKTAHKLNIPDTTQEYGHKKKIGET